VLVSSKKRKLKASEIEEKVTQKEKPKVNEKDDDFEEEIDQLSTPNSEPKLNLEELDYNMVATNNTGSMINFTSSDTVKYEQSVEFMFNISNDGK
jgi:hypothetical protein